MAAIDLALLPGAFLVDVFPIRMSSGQNNYLRKISRNSLPQSNMSQSGFLELVLRGSRGSPRRTLTIPLPLRSNMLKNLLRFVDLPCYSPIQLKRTPGGDSYHSVDRGYVFGGTTGTC